MRGQQGRWKRIAAALVGALCVALPCASAPAQDARDLDVWFEVDALNADLPALEATLDLETPQACVENFVLACREGDFARAARSLDFRLFESLEVATAEEAARRFFYVLNQELWIDWDSLPDRPDGVIEGTALGNPPPMAGMPRRSIRIGHIDLPERRVPVRLDRVKVGDSDPVWVFSAHTVHNIDEMYAAHGPTWLAELMPAWSRERGPWRVPIWQWIALAILLVLGPLLGWLTAVGAVPLITRRLEGDAGRLGRRLRLPVTLFVVALVAWIGIGVLIPLPSAIAALAKPIVLVLLIAASAWVVMRIIGFLMQSVLEKVARAQHEADESRQGRMLTQLTVLRHVVALVIALIGISVALYQLDLFDTVGVTLLTSAGAAAVIVGIAGHAVLGNLIAALQIALSQPFRLGDTVIVEGNWGQIEEIAYTYVVVRTWDERRLIVPIRHFVTNTIENWSKTDEYLVKPVYVRVDYRADVGRIREKFLELVQEDEAWAKDRDDPELLVTDAGDETMTVRLTAGGATVSDAWYLSCRLRENMIAWLQDVEDGAWLPRERIVLDDQASGEQDPSAPEPGQQFRGEGDADADADGGDGDS